jgi:zinc transport system permease protein
MMILSSILSGLFTFAGLGLSFWLNLTSGATIILVAAAGFFAALLWERLKHRRPENPPGEKEKPG